MFRKSTLTGPFSPISNALLNIRNRLLFSKEPTTHLLLTEVLLQELLVIGIPMKGKSKQIIGTIGFPLAACRKPGSEKLLFRYAGYVEESQLVDDSNPGIQRLLESQLIIRKEVLRFFERKEDSNFFKRTDHSLPKEGGWQRWRESRALTPPFLNTKIFDTDLPESLRKKHLCGFAKFACGGLQWLLFSDYRPHYQSELSLRKAYWERVIRELRTQFFSEEVYLHLLKHCSHQSADWSEQAPTRRHVHQAAADSRLRRCAVSDEDRHGYRLNVPDLTDTDPTETTPKKFKYAILRDRLSEIQAAAKRTANVENFTHQTELPWDFERCIEEVFSLVFVLPSLLETNERHEYKLCYRYVLTHKQANFLESLEWADVEAYLCRTRDTTFRVLQDEAWNLGIVENTLKSEDYQHLIDRLTDCWDPQERTEANSKIEELLRRAIYAWYAYHPETISTLRDELPDILSYTESDKGAIADDQAFLVDQIIKFKHSDIVENYINHPLAKYIQRSTESLVQYYRENFKPQGIPSLYPRALHLLETAFIVRKPIILYPLYQFGAPMLLCALNLRHFITSRQAIFGFLQAQSSGIFLSIIDMEITDAARRFSKSQSIIENHMEKALGEFAGAVFRFMVHFSPREVGISGQEFISSAKDSLPLQADFGRILQAPDNPLRFRKPVTESAEGLNIFNDNLTLLQRTFARYWEVRQGEAESQTLSWAHAIKTEIGGIEMVHKKRPLVKGYPEALSLINKERPDLYAPINATLNDLDTEIKIYSRSLGSLRQRVTALQMSQERNKEINHYINITATTRDPLYSAIYESFRVLFVNFLLSTKRECSAKRKRWLKPDYLPYSSTSKTLMFRLIDKLSSSECTSKHSLYTLRDIFTQSFIDRSAFPLEFDVNAFVYDIPSDQDRYYPNVLTIIISEALFNSFKYCKSSIHLQINKHREQSVLLSLTNDADNDDLTSDEEKSQVGIHLIKTLASRILGGEDVNVFTNTYDKRYDMWRFVLPMYLK